MNKILVAVFSIGLLVPGLSQEDSIFYAGMASINITPEIPIRMSGYGNRNDPFSAVHDSIYATALVMNLGNQTLVIAAADVVGFSHDFVKQTKQIILEQNAIDPKNVLMIAAHNHGGPVTGVYSDDNSPTELEYYKSLQNKIAGVIGQAQRTMQPAKIGAGKGTCSMNINRRARFANGTIWLGRNPDGPCDREVGIVRIDNLSGNPIGAFLNWPCHATVSGQSNTEITGDWPGATASFFRKKTNTTLLVTAGASADINAIYGPNNKFGDIAAIGMILGQESVNVFSGIKTRHVRSLAMKTTNFLAPGKKRSASRKPNELLEQAPDRRIDLSAIKIGNLILTGVSGELMTEIGMDIKLQSPYKDTFVITHCNGSSGYLCTDAAYKEGGYEPMVSRVMPGTADKIRETIQKLILDL